MATLLARRRRAALLASLAVLVLALPASATQIRKSKHSKGSTLFEKCDVCKQLVERFMGVCVRPWREKSADTTDGLTPGRWRGGAGRYDVSGLRQD